MGDLTRVEGKVTWKNDLGNAVAFYQDKNGEWRWNVQSTNGRIVGDSSEGYKNEVDARDGLRLAVAIATEWAQEIGK